MISFSLWVFGMIVLASMIMVISWGNAARLIFLEEIDEGFIRLLFCKPFMIAMGLTIHAAFMIVACGYRLIDILTHQTASSGSNPKVQLFGLCGIGLSKVIFVWAGSTDEKAHSLRWPWYVFLYLSIAWAVFCGYWAAYF